MKKLTTEEWIAKARKVHGDRYDYSETVYVKSAEKVKIWCRVHGMFWQLPLAHLKGFNCKQCGHEETASKKALTTKDFISKAKKVHGNRYDYSKVEYEKTTKAVVIRCRIHKEFLQRPDKHLKGHNCPACADKQRITTKRDTREEFIQKARATHGDEYDYTKVIYINSLKKVEIVCPHHGSFRQAPNKHVMGNGCPECGKTKNKQRSCAWEEEFLTKAKTIHDNKYSYEKASYRSWKAGIIITCPSHGEFKVSPEKHLTKAGGCKKCEAEEAIRSGKICIKCGKKKPLNKYHKNNRSLDKKSNTCKTCVEVYSRTLADYSLYGPQLVPSDRPTDINGDLYVACKKCKKLFRPTNKQCQTRVRKINQTEGSSDFYCSDECKGACDVFKAITTPKSLRNKNNPRDCYRPIKSAMKQLQCDEYGEVFCERCGDIIDVDLHHTQQIKVDKENVKDVAGTLLLCPGCHTALHNECK